MDINNPYDVLNGYFPGRFTLRERLHPSDDAPPSRENFNLADAAEYLGVSQRHLKDLCRERRIVFTKLHYRALSAKLPNYVMVCCEYWLGIQDELDRLLKRFEFPRTTPHSRSTAL